MKKRGFMAVLVISFLLIGPASNAAELKAEAITAMEAAGFSPYPGSVFCTGTVEMGMRFATGDSPDAVRSWLVENLTDWSLMQDEELGLWMLFDGPPETKGFAKVSTFNHVVVLENVNLPVWHDLAETMTTEILVALPRGNKGEEGEPLLVIPGLEQERTQGLTRKSKPEGMVGSLYQAEDVESSHGGFYYYLQDENYFEYIVAKESDLPEAIARKLDSISISYDSVRIVGDILVDEENGIYMFDRSKEIKIFLEDSVT